MEPPVVSTTEPAANIVSEPSPIETIADQGQPKDTSKIEKHAPKVTRQKPTGPQDLQQLYLQSIQNAEGDSLFRDREK